MSDALCTFAGARTDRIFGCNRTGTLISAHTPVKILTSCRLRARSEVPQHIPFLITPVTRSTSTLGVTLVDIPNNGCGEVQISGFAPCRLSSNCVNPQFVLAGDGELVQASYGWPVYTVAGTPSITFVLLGGCCSNYVGTFAVVPSDNGFYCYDSAHPEETVAGRSDLGDVSAGSITATGGHFSLYLWHDGETYHQSFTKPDVTRYGEVTLAELVNGTPRQTWTQGTIHWSQWYLL